MFINPVVFKKLIKEAWEARVLILSQKEGVLMIQGGYWIVDAQMDVIPYKVRAALVELCGTLPEEGMTFRAGKGEAPQYEFEQTVHWDWLKQARSEELPEAYITRALFKTKWGEVYRAARQGREMVFINNMLIDAIAPDEVMEGWEDRVTGPTVLYRGLVWKNSAGTAIFLPTKLEDDIAESYLRCLEDMEVE